MHRTCDPPQIHKPIGRRRRRHLPAQSGGRITYPRSPPRARGRRPFIYLPAAQSPAGRVDGNVDGWQHQARLPARARAQGYTRLARGRTRSLWCLSPCKRVDFRRTPADACMPVPVDVAVNRGRPPALAWSTPPPKRPDGVTCWCCSPFAFGARGRAGPSASWHARERPRAARARAPPAAPPDETSPSTTMALPPSGGLQERETCSRADVGVRRYGLRPWRDSTTDRAAS